MSIIEAPHTILDDPEVLTRGEERLLNAERYMREHGWTRREAIDESGRVCLVGALSFGNDCGDCYFETYSYYDPAYIALVKAVGSCNVVRWNDRDCKSEDEALTKLREARELLAANRTG